MYIVYIVYMRINIWIPDKKLKEIDISRKKGGLSRSEYLVKCATRDPIIFEGNIGGDPDNPFPLKSSQKKITEEFSVSEDNSSQFSDKKKKGYHYASYLGKYIKD